MQVAGHDEGKEALRVAGVLPVLVSLVRRHTAPYVAAAAAQPSRHSATNRSAQQLSGFAGAMPGRNGEVADAADGSGSGSGRAASAAGGGGYGGGGSGTGPYYAMQVSHHRPAAHVGCDIHAGGYAQMANGHGGAGGAGHGTGGTGAALDPYLRNPHATFGSWTPWQRLTAVLLIHGLVPQLSPPLPRQGQAAAAAGATAGEGVGRSAVAAAAEGGEIEAAEPGTPSPVSLSDLEDDEDGDNGGAAQQLLQPHGHLGSATAGDATAARGKGQSPVVAGARLACYGLLLPVLVEPIDVAALPGSSGAAGGGSVSGGAGAAAAAVGGAMLRRRLCPLRECLATAKTLMCDCEPNQLELAKLGLPQLLVQVGTSCRTRAGDMPACQGAWDPGWHALQSLGVGRRQACYNR